MIEQLPVYLSLSAAAFFAGLLDAIVGGGGLIQVPALFSALPSALPATLFATNKFSGIFGTAIAARTYWKKYPVDWGVVLPASAAAFVFAMAGAWAISIFPPDVFRKLLPVMLLLVAGYVFRHKEFGAEYMPTRQGRHKVLLGFGVGAAMGLYDGFFGPGTGSFLIFLFIRGFGLDFLRASAAAKIVNVVCNFAALAWFVPTSQPLWVIGGLMAACNILGSTLGARLALKQGTHFVRRIFLLVVFALILKTGWDAFGSIA